MSNPVYGKPTKTSSRDEKRPAILWVLLIGMIGFLLWSPFQVALFNGQLLDFEKAIYTALIISCLLLFVWMAAFFKDIRLSGQRDWLLVAVLLLPLTYLLSLATAASHYLAMNMVLIQAMYAFLFMISLYLLQDRQANRIMQNALMAIAYLIVGFGLLNWLGLSKLAGSLVGWVTSWVRDGVYVDAIWVDANGPRLTSVFQYANTYAAFLMAFLLAAVFCLTKAKSTAGKLVHGLMLVPILISLLLTLSRSGMVLLPVVFILLLLFLRPAKQLLWFIHCVLAGVVSLAVLTPITDLGLQLHEKTSAGASAKGWAYLLVASLVGAGLSWLVEKLLAPRLERMLHGWSERKAASLWIPLGSVVLAAIVAFLLIGTGLRSILPQNVETRLENINLNQHSVLERITFYKDAAKLWQDYPLIGAGGGAWAALYEQYQNNPYTSRQAHNFFLQYLVETGLVGFIVFMAFIIFIFYKYIRGYIKHSEQERESHFLFIIITLSILIHSLLDFNMSYVFMGMLVFIGLSGMAAHMDNKPLTKASTSGKGARIGYTVFIGIAGLVLFFTSIRFIQSANAAVEARGLAQSSQSYESIQQALNKDLSIRNTHPDSVVLQSTLYQSAYKQTKDEQYMEEDQILLDRGLAAEPHNKNMLYRLISHNELLGKEDAAYQLLMEKAPDFAWDIQWYETLIAKSFELGNQDKQKNNLYYQNGLKAYQHVLDGIAHLKTLPAGQMQGRPFEVTPVIALNAGKMQYMTTQTEQAAATLKGGLRDDLNDAANRETARWYLAALSKLRQKDQALYDKLIQIDPAEGSKIQSIAAMTF
ncbi:O-antigen ligase family protein [Paenibacillus sp. JX-17]|uniref:O-antigen ligase family protein n=1 Tax=Paenibacillus lacisoli TaxID=3064525 RepID=A0ABT9CMM3_9BACL|nr:O-antigen ligase family protein [Paenibacillus sp. JX-17]MDO7908848.1 O-antigen ligase family protein [Paenibacillus sp. JX-17]